MAWDEIIGQDLPKRILQTHLKDGRVANGYLICGPEGVGKKRLALEMAKALNCESEKSRPCGSCRFCQQITRGTHPDVHLVVPGGASDQIKIDQIRHILGRIGLRPFNARYQVVILEQAERLTEEAANSLLKSLEEPSAHTRFLLTTSQLSACLPTIRSRCQIIRAQPLAAEVIEKILLQADPPVDAQTAAMVAELSSGSASRALELARRWDAYQQLLNRFAGEDLKTWIESPAVETREEVRELLDGLMGWLRDVALAAATADEHVRHRQHREAIFKQASRIDLDRCLTAAEELIKLRESVDQFISPRLVAVVARETWLSLIQQTPAPIP